MGKYKALDGMRNNYSMELFNKLEAELSISEQQTLNQFIKDNANITWKQVIVDGIPTKYQISNTGVLKTTFISKGIPRDHIMHPALNSSGYPQTVIVANGKRKTVAIHRLVANAFIPNPENKSDVNHKNGNKLCNWVGNLEWMSRQENIYHAIRTGLRDSFGTKFMYSDEIIHKVCKLLEKGYKVADVSRALGVNNSLVSHIKQGVQWKHISKNYNIPIHHSINTDSFDYNKLSKIS